MSLAVRLLGAAALVLVACSDTDPDPPDGASPGDIDAMFADAERAGFIGAALVVVDGEPVFAQGFGLANRARMLPNTIDTAFDVGSLMKGVTAAAIYALEEQGQLSVTDPLGELLPDVPDDKASITLLQVLEHSAGFRTYHDTEGDFEPMTRLEARARILGQSLLFEPGGDVSYSNSGYTLLADIVETVSGTPFTEFVAAELFARAELAQTGFYSEDRWQTAPTAVGYGSDTFGDNDPATWPYTWSLVGNGGLVSSVADLERWIVALESGRVLAPEAYARLREATLEPDAVTLAGERVYAGAGAGDFGLGGVVVTIPGRQTRILLASNAYDRFDIEDFAGELVFAVLDAD